jgi:hypothetical protein
MKPSSRRTLTRGEAPRIFSEIDPGRRNFPNLAAASGCGLVLRCAPAPGEIRPCSEAWPAPTGRGNSRQGRETAGICSATRYGSSGSNRILSVLRQLPASRIAGVLDAHGWQRDIVDLAYFPISCYSCRRDPLASRPEPGPRCEPRTLMTTDSQRPGACQPRRRGPVRRPEHRRRPQNQTNPRKIRQVKVLVREMAIPTVGFRPS